MDRLKENILTDGNLHQLVDLVNQELRPNGALYEEQMSQTDQQLGEVERKLAKLHGALESGRVDIDDLAPQVGFEPTTNRLTADRSTTELLRSVNEEGHLALKPSLASPCRHAQDSYPTSSRTRPSPPAGCGSG